jgi:perosamine synthetase
MDKIPLFRPKYRDEILEDLRSVFYSGWTGLGPKTEEFEKQYAILCKSKYAIAFNSCTSAIRCWCEFKFRKGIRFARVSPLTFASTASEPFKAGMIINWTDIHPETLCMRAIGTGDANFFKDTCCHIPTCYGGSYEPFYDFAYLKDLKGNSNLSVLIDAAHCCPPPSLFSFPSGMDAAWSFHAVKPISCGDGGMLTTDDEELMTFARKWRWFGISSSTHERSTGGYKWDYSIRDLGEKAHMNDITATIGLSQLKHFIAGWTSRSNIHAQYVDCLYDVKEIFFQRLPFGSSHHLMPIMVPMGYRDDLIRYLLNLEIETGVHYKPLYLHAGLPPLYVELPNVEAQWGKLISLPMWIGMTPDDVRRVCDGIREWFGHETHG